MADRKIYFATDIHGSEVCLRKFLNAAKFYGCDTLIMGGDITGKMIVPIVDRGQGVHTATLYGRNVRVTADGLAKLRKTIADAGYYAYETTPEEIQRFRADPDAVTELFGKLMHETLGRWLELTEARLAGTGVRCFFAPGIAARGWTVMTGGYGGLMEVTSRAAAQAGGRVVGVPVRGWTQLTPNRWSHELRWTDSYPERLAHFLAADAIVALDGGIGTLSEAAIAWAALQTEPVAADLIFLGASWPTVLGTFAGHLTINDRDLALVTICADADSVVAHIAQTRPGRQRAAHPRG